MTRSMGNKANDLLQPNFRDDLGSPPNLGNAPVGHAPAPSTVRQAHSFTADDLARLLGSKFDAADRAAFDAAFAGYRK